MAWGKEDKEEGSLMAWGNYVTRKVLLKGSIEHKTRNQLHEYGETIVSGWRLEKPEVSGSFTGHSTHTTALGTPNSRESGSW